MVTKQITYRGVRGHSYQAVELALRTMAEGSFPLEMMSTHVVGLSGLDGALKMVGGQGTEWPVDSGDLAGGLRKA